MAHFVLKEHGGLDDEQKVFLLNVKTRHHWGSPTSVGDLHDLVCLYYEARGYAMAMAKNAEKGLI